METSIANIDKPRAEMRIEAWDYLRLLAFVDIACLHLIGQHVLLGLGLPSFVMITCALALTSSASTLSELLSVRVRRLFVPWMFWSLVLCAQIAYAQLKHGAPVLEGFEGTMVFYGAGQHLWFLPYAALSALFVFALHQRLSNVGTEPLIVACTIASFALLLLQPTSRGLELPFAQWVFASPGIPLGLALGRILVRHRDTPDSWRAWTFLGIGLLFLATAMLALPDIDELTVSVMRRFTIACGLLVVVTRVSLPSTRFMRTLRPLMFGAYVLHPFIGYQLMRFTRDKLALVSMTITATLGLVLALRRTPLRTML
jgi:surface polysaccharide O-acyltransferase-like enzyme